MNALGASDPLVSDEPIVAKDPFGVPSSPGRPQIVDMDVDHIDLKWQAPSSDGGRKIVGYNVLRREASSGRWLKINSAPVDGLAYSDTSVTKSHGYEYKIVAINAHGLSEPSAPSEMAYARPSAQAPVFDLDIDGREIRVRAGDPLELHIPYSAAPQPTIKWTRLADNSELAGITTTADYTRLYIEKSRRSDSGQVRIEASNAHGRCEARVLISVIDRPSAPEGPMTYPTTTRRSVTVAWKPPTDQGNCELLGYRVDYQVGDRRSCARRRQPARLVLQELGDSEWTRLPETTSLLYMTVKNLRHNSQVR